MSNSTTTPSAATPKLTWRALAKAAYRRLPGQTHAALQRELRATRHSLELLRNHVGTMDHDAEQLRMAVNHELQYMRPELAEVARLRSEDRAEVVRLLAALRGATALHGASATSEAQPRWAGADPASRSAGADPAHLDGFYEGFERRFRGTHEEIRERLSVYLPDVAGLRESDGVVLDLGPGHGEWLELLAEHGITAYGVDTNERFVALGRERGFDVRHEDAVAHLQSVAPSSLGAVTAFHVIEHLPLDTAVELIDQCLRALRPGGLLVLETPNPLNLRVGAGEFWLDPTHIRPMHPQLLDYLLRNRGFADVSIRFLHTLDDQLLTAPPPDGPLADFVARLADTMNRMLFSAMDYAVLAAAPRGGDTPA